MTITTSIPSEKDAALARDSSYILSHAQTDSLTFSIKQSDGSERQLQLPSIAIAALNEILTAIGQCPPATFQPLTPTTPLQKSP